MRGTRLAAVGEEDVALVGEQSAAAPSPPRDNAAQRALTGLLLTSLKVVSQRTIIALASLVDLAILASAFALWVMIIQTPTVLQLVGTGMYGALVLIALGVRGWHR